MDELNHGIYDPRVLRDYLAYARSRYRPGPERVVLAGAGNFDYRDLLGLGGNPIPPLMVSTPYGLFASDNSLVDFDRDLLPDIQIGRLPVLTAAELDAVVMRALSLDPQARFTSGREMAAALEFRGYDYRFEYGDGAHTHKHGGALLPETLRWLWRDYPKPITKSTSTEGERHFVNPVGPGWASHEGKWDDARVVGKDKKHYGSLPREWAHYEGTYLHSNKVVIAASIGGARVLAQPTQPPV
ncbi:MAG: hypothetical protein HC793_02935 [Aquincola sp.]|nr:hypothetical protein [Aquincola sp.]